MSDVTVAKTECPICHHETKFVLSKDATLKSFDDMNWKQRVRKAIERICFNEWRDCGVSLIQELGL